MYSHMFKGAPLGNDNAKGPHEFHAALDQHISRLQGEAADWAGRQYKPNDNVVHHQGDGPGREFQSISSINRNRKDNNVAARQSQISALQSVKDMPLSTVKSKFEHAKGVAAFEQKNNGRNYDQVLESQIGKNFAGMKDSTHGPNSIGGSLKPILHAAFPPAKASAVSGEHDSGWMKTLFGGK